VKLFINKNYILCLQKLNPQNRYAILQIEMLLLSISHIFRSVDTRRNIFISNWCYVCCWTCTTMPRLTGHL